MVRSSRALRLLQCFSLATLVACGGTSNNSSAPAGEVPSAVPHSISGLVSGGPDVTKVTISLDPGGVSVQPNSYGDYTFEEVADGTYTISPSLPGYVFDPPSRSLTLDRANAQDFFDQDFVMKSDAPATTPAIPLPKSIGDELPGRSEELVTDVAPVKDFNPYADSSELSDICSFTVKDDVTLVKDGVSVQPTLSTTYEDCDWFGLVCKDKHRYCTGPLIAAPPYLRRTVYWQKVFQALVGPGAGYTQAWAVINGSSTSDAQTMAKVMNFSVGARFDWLGFSSSISKTFSHTVTVTLTETQSVTQTFSCPPSASDRSTLFAVWQLHERFDFSDEAGEVAWSDPVYHPASEPGLPVLDNAMSIFFESTTVF
jgi:hypothetical protein